MYNLISTNAWFWKRNNSTPFWPSFLTLTFKENITDVKEGNYLQSKFIKRLNYYIYKTKKTEIKYLSVIELSQVCKKLYKCTDYIVIKVPTNFDEDRFIEKTESFISLVHKNTSLRKMHLLIFKSHSSF